MFKEGEGTQFRGQCGGSFAIDFPPVLFPYWAVGEHKMP